MRELGFESLSFEEAVERESERIGPEIERIREDPAFYSRLYLRFSYLERGKYGEQLENWFQYFDRSRFLILESEELYRNPDRTYQRILGFLNLRDWRPHSFEVYSSATSTDPANAHAEIAPHLYRRLVEVFEPHNRRLAELLGTSFSWSGSSEA